MRITVKTGIITAFCWVFIKLAFYYTGIFQDTKYEVPSGMLIILGLLISIAIGLYLHKIRSNEASSTLMDIKSAMTAGVPYSVLVSIFIYFYHTKIDPDYIRHNSAEREIQIKKDVNNPEALAQYIKKNPEAEVMTKEEIEAQEIEKIHFFSSPSLRVTLALLGLTVLSTFYSVLITIIYKRLIFAHRR